MGWFGRKKPEPRIIWHVPEGREDLVPRRATRGSMAFDLVSPESVEVPAYHPDLGVGSALINTFVVASIPPGYALLLRSRSGLAAKAGITVEAGEIDTDYRGFLKVLLYNHSGMPYEISAGDRIAQVRIIKVHDLEDAVSFEYPNPDETARGAGGFGSTGK